MTPNKTNKNGFTLAETMVCALLLAIIFMSGSMLFVAGQSLWSFAGGHIQLQENARRTLQKVSFELRESGRDANGILQLWISNNTGPNNSDILRLAMPLCLCGRSVMDETMNIRTWGAPLSWGSTECTENYPVGPNGKVTICHLPPGNPNNAHTLQVGPPAVKAHLAHGDWIGDCDDCDPYTYNNRFIEYRLDQNNQMVRRVLDVNLVEINATVIGSHIADFQIQSISDRQYQVEISLATQVYPQRAIALTRSELVILRNY